MQFTLAEVNSVPALLLWLDGRVESLLILDLTAEQIPGVRLLRNPDKLAYVTRQARALSAGPSPAPA
jgi:hypothetical protein